MKYKVTDICSCIMAYKSICRMELNLSMHKNEIKELEHKINSNKKEIRKYLKKKNEYDKDNIMKIFSNIRDYAKEWK